MLYLIYLRKHPAHRSFYMELSRFLLMNDSVSVLTISEFRDVGDIWLGKCLYDKCSSQGNIPNMDLFSIYYRCRFLRSIGWDKALDLMSRMSNYINHILLTLKPKVVIGPLVDNYTLDILEFLCKQYGIIYVSFSGHLFNGYSRINSRGEYNYFPRTVNDNEVSCVLDKITKDSYVPNFHDRLKVSHFSKLCFFYREWLKRNLFNIYKYYYKDKYNYHYNTVNNWPIYDCNNYINRKREHDLFCHVDEIEYSDRNILFPLHLTPEATVDYWVEDPLYAFCYLDKIRYVIENSTSNTVFLIKEHPAMYCLRNKHFYEELLRYDNVKLIHPLDSSNLLLSKVKYVFTENGSIGIEALLRDKIVIANSVSYYSSLHPNLKMSDLVTDELLSLDIENYDNRLFVRDVLQGLFKSQLYNDNNILKSDFDLIYKNVSVYINYKLSLCK